MNLISFKLAQNVAIQLSCRRRPDEAIRTPTTNVNMNKVMTSRVRVYFFLDDLWYSPNRTIPQNVLTRGSPWNNRIRDWNELLSIWRGIGFNHKKVKKLLPEQMLRCIINSIVKHLRIIVKFYILCQHRFLYIHCTFCYVSKYFCFFIYEKILYFDSKLKR